MNCKFCGSKYVELNGTRHELNKTVYVYYCHSCKKYYYEDAVANAGALNWLMTFHSDNKSQITEAVAEINMNSDGKLVVNQLYKGKHSVATSSPRLDVVKGGYTNTYALYYSVASSVGDTNDTILIKDVMFNVEKIELNPQLTTEALKNDAMKALHKKDNLFVISKQHSPVLLNDAVAWLAPALGGKAKKKGCYVATCVYGSYDCPEVWTLRRFRDDTLATTWYGRAFIRLYYAVSPTAVKLFGETKWFRGFWKKHLDKLVAKLQSEGVESTRYSDRPW